MSICNECQQTEQDCGCTNSTPCISMDCTCPVKDLSSDCWVYTGLPLECSNIQTGVTGTELIQQLDEFICNKFDFMANYFQLLNVGNGAEIYAGDTLTGQKQLRTIVSGNPATTDVVENIEEIEVTAGEHELTFESDILNLIVTTLQGSTTLSSIDLSAYTADTFLTNAQFNSGTSILTLTLNDASTFPVDLSSLDNHLESAVYNAGTQEIDFTLTDSTVIPVDISQAVSDASVQADYLESNLAEPSFIVNKNPTKSEVVTTSYSVTDGDNNYVIEIQNGANDVNIDVSSITLTDNFFTGVVQNGTGTITFTGQDITPATLTAAMQGQGHVAAVEVIGGTTYVFGNLVPA